MNKDTTWLVKINIICPLLKSSSFALMDQVLKSHNLGITKYTYDFYNLVRIFCSSENF